MPKITAEEYEALCEARYGGGLFETVWQKEDALVQSLLAWAKAAVPTTYAACTKSTNPDEEPWWVAQSIEATLKDDEGFEPFAAFLSQLPDGQLEAALALARAPAEE